MNNFSPVSSPPTATVLALAPPLPATDLPAEYARLIAQMASALRIAHVAVNDWINISAPEHCAPARVEQARNRVREHGLLFYQVTVADAIRHALRGAPVALDPEHDDALCWRTFCTLPAEARQRLVQENAHPAELMRAINQSCFDGTLIAGGNSE